MILVGFEFKKGTTSDFRYYIDAPDGTSVGEWRVRRNQAKRDLFEALVGLTDWGFGTDRQVKG